MTIYRHIALLIPMLCCAVGCHNAPPSGYFACGDEQLCPEGQQCGADGVCYTGDEVPITPDAPVVIDAAPDAAGCPAWDSLYLDPTQVSDTAPDLVLTMPGMWVLNTDTAMLNNPDLVPQNAGIVWTQPNGTEVLLLAVDHLVVGPNVVLRAVGARPLLVAAYDVIHIVGSIDVSTGNDGLTPGAGAQPTSCASHAAGNGQSGADDGGGGGAGYQAAGGRGGDGEPAGGVTALGGAPGGSVALPVVLSGGCRGGRGGGADSGLGGRGGGAVLLAARCEVQIDGIVNAGGAGGRAGLGDRAAGGGGSGGWIGLEAPVISVAAAAVLAANGGGGGGGGVNAIDGKDGRNAVVGTTAAAGGESPGGTGVGGAGGALALPAGSNGGNGFDGGGGGGGSVGFIVVRATSATVDASAISPAWITPGN